MKHFISSLSVLCANPPPCEGRISSRKILSLLLILFLSIGNAWAEEVVYKTALFGSTYNSEGVSGYTSVEFSSTNDGFTVVVQNANNNNNQWSSIKIGGKKGAYTGTITTEEAVDKSITKVDLTIVNITASNVTSLELYSSSNQKDWTKVGDFDKSKGVKSVEIQSPNINLYYQVKAVCSQGTSNGLIEISKIEFYTSNDESETPVASLTVNPTTIDFGTVYEGATVADKTVAVNFANLNGDVTYSVLSTPFSATGNISTTGDNITISAVASTIGEYSQTLTVASTADSKTAKVTVKMNVVAAPAPTGTFTLHTGALVEGDYVIVSTNSLKAEVNSDRLASLPVTISNDEIVDPDATTIWHIAKSGEYWTLYNANKAKYAASTGAKNKAALLDDATDDKALWSVTGTSTYEFVNKKNTANSVNANLRYNSGNAENSRWACYSTSTGGALSLYRKAGTKYNVTVNSTTKGTVTADPTSAEAGTNITLTVTPETGYVLDALTVTDASSNTIEVADNKFTMPASDVTVTATFKENEKPAATLTLSKNGVEEPFPGEHKVGDVITLPDFMSDCSKTFVGWDSKSDCTEAPEYAPGAEYTLAAENQTLYAVYANVVEGAPVNVFSETFDACEGSGGNDDKWSGSIASGTLSLTDWELVKGSPANGCAKFGTGSAKGSAETPAITLTGNATLTFRSGAWNGSSEKTTLNLSAIGATLSQTSVTLVKGAWTEYTIYITEATGSVKIKFEASVDDSNRFFLDDVVVSQASVTYSDYSTTCTAALDAPTFTPVAGTYNEVTNVTISATDDVYYTLDGTTPTKESNKYTGPIILNLNGTTTIKAIAISGESQSSVVSATYSIKLPLTTMDEIFAAATTAGGAEAPVLITMNNWVVSAIRDDNKTAYVTDGTKGFVIYKEDHGFNVGDILSGTVACNVQLFKGSAELTELTATTEGLTVTTGGVVSPVVVNDVTTLGGVNTGSLIKINGVHASDNIVNNVKLYNTLFSFENLTPGQEYNVTGVYLQFGDTKEILPRSAADIEEVAGIPTATISIENITLVEGDEHAIVAVVTPAEAEGKVTYSIKSGSEYISLLDNVITANAVGTATITAAIAEVDGVYHGTTKDFTVTVKEYVAPISGRWELVTDASTLKAGDKVIVAQYVEEDGTIYTMGGQKTNNRDVVGSSVLGETLTPTTGTAVLTLVDAGDGTFAFQASNGKYLSAAGTGTSNHLREAENYDSDKTKWTISVTAEGIATIKATSDNRNWMRYNPNNGSPLFSCYGSAQQDIALYKKMPDYTRDVRQGYYGTICLPNGGVMVGASIFEIAYKDASKIYFDEILNNEMVAGIPYIFLPNEGVTELEVYYTDEADAPAGSKNGLVGYYDNTDDMFNVPIGNYILLNNQYCKVVGTKAYIMQNYSYIVLGDVPGSAPAPAPGVRRVSMGVTGQNTATGVDQVQGDNVPTKMIINGQLFILRGEKMYDAQGKLVK